MGCRGTSICGGPANGSTAVARVLQNSGSLFLNVGAKPKDPWTALDVAQAARPHLELQNIIHWVKSIAIEKALAGSRAGLADDLAVGHYKPINSERFLNDCHEFVFHFSPTGDTPLDRRAVGVKYQDKSNVTRWQQAGSGLRCRGNTWFIPYDTIQSRDKERPHPATFPARLPEYCLRLHGRKRAAAGRRSVPGTGQHRRGLRRRWASASSASSSTSTTSPRRCKRTEAALKEA